MTDGPTIVNGPLHTDRATLDDRQIVAYFATRDGAEAAKEALGQAGIPAASIAIDAAADASDTLAPAEDSIIGKIREAVMPEDSQQATRDAAANNDVRLTVIPGVGDVDRIVAIIQAAGPHHFDADLERWRNSPPA